MTELREYQSRQQRSERQPSQATVVPPALAHLVTVATAMRGMLAACLAQEEIEVEVVHQLRTGTRRVEATLETLAREAGARGLAAEAEQTRQRWLRRLKKVRRASGAVRDLDVHRELLAEHYLSKHTPEDAREDMTIDAYTSATAPDSPPAKMSTLDLVASAAVSLGTQAHSLDTWLADRRDTAVKALRYALQDREKKLVETEQAFVAAFAKQRSVVRRTQRPAARLALEDYLRLMDAMPHLDAANLHDFRKGAKKARYVAEAGGEDPAALAMTKAIKRVQDAIGDWHDWEVLAEEARQALDDSGVLLEKDLDRKVKRAYERALRTASNMGRRFVGEWQATRPPRSRPQKAVIQKSR